jgi:hypothetical protein
MNADRRLIWLARILTGIGLLAIVLVAWGGISQPGISLVEQLSTLTFASAGAAFVVCGALIVSSRPQNVVGWLLMVPGLALGDLAGAWLRSLTPPPSSFDLVTWLLAWFTNWSWVLLIFPIFFVLLIFPSGTLLSPRWRAVVLLDGGMVATMLLLSAFADQLGPFSDGEPSWRLPNPIGFIAGDVLDSELGSIWNLGLLVATVGGVAAVIVRFRRGSYHERQQLKWPLLGISFFGAVYAAMAVGSGWEGTALLAPLFGLSLAAIPVTVAVAVTRYRLYEIDRIISRTVSWSLLTACLAAIFALVVIGVQALLAGVTQGQSLAIAASTLVVSMLFNPIRLRLQRAVDRRFNRSRYDADRTLTAFAERLRDQVELGQVDEALMDAVTTAVQPNGASLWMRSDASRR